jgi:hypothetical protein
MCAAIVALATACSSSTSGTGSSGTGGGGGAGGSSGGVSAPPSGGGGSTDSGGGGGAATGDFCTDWTHIGDLSKIVSPTGIQQQVVARFDRLAAEAPADIKPAVVDVDQYIHNAVSGHVDPQASTKLGQDFQQIGEWIVHNCH